MSVLTAMQLALAESFAFYGKAHVFHWNVTGTIFPSFHRLFGDIYEDVHDAIDAIAEHIRTLDEMAPASLTELLGPATIEDAPATITADGMVRALIADNETVLVALNSACTEAVKAGKAGLANFLQDRIDAHAKWGWMLRATGGP